MSPPTNLEQRLSADVVLEKVRGTVNLYKVTKNRHPAFHAMREGKILDKSAARDLFFKMGLAWNETDTGILGTRCQPLPTEAAGSLPPVAG